MVTISHCIELCYRKIGDVRIELRLRFHRDKLQAAADGAEADDSIKYIGNRVFGVCFTEFICEIKALNPVPRRG